MCASISNMTHYFECTSTNRMNKRYSTLSLLSLSSDQNSLFEWDNLKMKFCKSC